MKRRGTAGGEEASGASGASGPSSSRAPAASFRGAVAALVVLAAVAFTASGVASSAPGAFDADVVRVVGLGWAGPTGALDRLAAAVFLAIPLGTASLRAALAASVLAGAAAWVVFVVADAFATAVLARVVPGAASPRLVASVSGAAALTAVLGPGFQREATAPGGSIVSALVLLLALRETLRAATSLDAGTDALRPPACALLLGLAATCDLAVLGAVVLVLAPLGRALFVRLRDPARLRHAAAALAVGLAPLATSLATRARSPEIADAGLGLTGSFAGLASVRALRTSRGLPAVASYLGQQVGPALVVAAGLGAVVVAIAIHRSGRGFRGLAVGQGALFALALAGAGAAAALGGATAIRVSPVVLAGAAALHAQAAVALAAVVLAIARTPVPFAQASASLVVVLEMVVPVRAADEALGVRASAPRDATEIWSEVAFGGAGPASLVLVAQPALARRVAAARATGDLRSDLLVVPAADVRGRAGTRALAAEPKLAPLFRDLALGSPPEELSLTQLAGARPVLLAFDPAWDRVLARHLLPSGLFTSFDAEPRGAVDRRKAFDQTGARRDRLVRAVVARRDPELVALTSTLLRARALAVAATSDKELLSRALDDLRPFAPDDPVAAQLVRRIVTSKGVIDIRDLAP